MVIPYLTFHGRCREALAYYGDIFATEPTMVQPYGDYVPADAAAKHPGLRSWVLHAEMQIAGAPFWFADDIGKPLPGSNIKLAVSFKDAALATEIFNKLAADGIITLPPTETFYSAFHAAATDQFGINWQIIAEKAATSDILQ